MKTKERIKALERRIKNLEQTITKLNNAITPGRKIGSGHASPFFEDQKFEFSSDKKFEITPEIEAALNLKPYGTKAET